MEGKRYIAVNSYPLFCSITDGLIGSRLQRLTEPTTLERAQGAVDKWFDSVEDEYGIPFEYGEAYVVESIDGEASRTRVK